MPATSTSKLSTRRPIDLSTADNLTHLADDITLSEQTNEEIYLSINNDNNFDCYVGNRIAVGSLPASMVLASYIKPKRKQETFCVRALNLTNFQIETIELQISHDSFSAQIIDREQYSSEDNLPEYDISSCQPLVPRTEEHSSYNAMICRNDGFLFTANVTPPEQEFRQPFGIVAGALAAMQIADGLPEYTYGVAVTSAIPDQENRIVRSELLKTTADAQIGVFLNRENISCLVAELRKVTPPDYINSIFRTEHGTSPSTDGNVSTIEELEQRLAELMDRRMGKIKRMTRDEGGYMPSGAEVAMVVAIGAGIAAGFIYPAILSAAEKAEQQRRNDCAYQLHEYENFIARHNETSNDKTLTIGSVEMPNAQNDHTCKIMVGDVPLDVHLASQVTVHTENENNILPDFVSTSGGEALAKFSPHKAVTIGAILHGNDLTLLGKQQILVAFDVTPHTANYLVTDLIVNSGGLTPEGHAILEYKISELNGVHAEIAASGFIEARAAISQMFPVTLETDYPQLTDIGYLTQLSVEDFVKLDEARGGNDSPGSKIDSLIQLGLSKERAAGIITDVSPEQLQGIWNLKIGSLEAS